MAADPNLGIPSYTAAIQATQTPSSSPILVAAARQCACLHAGSRQKAGEIINIGFDTSPQVVAAFKDGWSSSPPTAAVPAGLHADPVALPADVYGLGAMNVDTGAVS